LRLATYEAQEAERARAVRDAEQRQLAEKGKIDEIMRAHQLQLEAERKRVAEMGERMARTERDRAISAALAGQPLVEHAAEDLARLWADEFEASEGADGRMVVRAKLDYRDPSTVIAERLASPRYAHFVRAANRGGSGGGGGTPNPTPGAGGADPPPTSPLDKLKAALALKYQVPTE
jgi:hypothetical protein